MGLRIAWSNAADSEPAIIRSNRIVPAISTYKTNVGASREALKISRLIATGRLVSPDPHKFFKREFDSPSTQPIPRESSKGHKMPASKARHEGSIPSSLAIYQKLKPSKHLPAKLV